MRIPRASARKTLMANSEKPIADDSSGKASDDFGLVWEDQPEQMQHKLITEVPIFVSDHSLDVKSQNEDAVQHILIEGDNLHALHTLLAVLKGKIDLIYIDPPYNRGQDDFRYNDNFISADDSYRHSKWLSFMDKRLRLAKQLLAEDGKIFISIDDNEQANLKLLCDSIFGHLNFIACLPTIMNLKGNQDQLGIAGTHEYTLVYAKDRSLVKFGQFDVDEEVVQDSWQEDEIGWWKQGAGMKATGANGPRHKRPNLFFPLYVAKDGSRVSSVHFDGADEVYPITNGEEMSWRWSKTKADVESSDLIAVGSSPSWTIYKKQRPGLGELPSSKPKSVLYKAKYSSSNATNQLKQLLGSRAFDYPKPVELCLDIVKIGSHRKDLNVLDFFAGSGTTLQAVSLLNSQDGGTRRCILVTNNENNICNEVTQPRIRAALTGVWADGIHEPLPGAMQFYRTDFIARKKSQDRMRTDLARHTVDLITIKEAAIPIKIIDKSLNVIRGLGSTIAIVTDAFVNHVDAEKSARLLARDGDELITYLFTWSDHGVEPELAGLWSDWRVEPLPADMLAQLRKLNPAQYDLFDEYPDGVAK